MRKVFTKKKIVIKKNYIKSKKKRPNPKLIIHEFGIGHNMRLGLASKFGIPHKEIYYSNRVKLQENKLDEFIITKKKFIFGDFLKRVLFEKRNAFLKAKSVRAFKYIHKLPSHGQRSKTNARSAKRRSVDQLFQNISFRQFYIKKRKGSGWTTERFQLKKTSKKKTKINSFGQR